MPKYFFNIPHQQNDEFLAGYEWVKDSFEDMTGVYPDCKFAQGLVEPYAVEVAKSRNSPGMLTIFQTKRDFDNWIVLLQGDIEEEDVFDVANALSQDVPTCSWLYEFTLQPAKLDRVLYFPVDWQQPGFKYNHPGKIVYTRPPQEETNAAKQAMNTVDHFLRRHISARLPYDMKKNYENLRDYFARFKGN
jgi:hypothetical protein